MKLWEKNNTAIDKAVERFTVGEDYIIDMSLLQYDIFASIAHAKTITKAKILSEKELTQLTEKLNELFQLVEKKQFAIQLQDEDMHTAIENFLTQSLGDAGKKIHTARSRNDQILVALRLYYKKQLFTIEAFLLQFLDELLIIAKKNEFIPLVGYTHLQKAMPSSVGLFFAAYSESLLDNLQLLESAFKLTDQSPLGSAASYGISINIDREYTASLLGFAKVQNNVMYVQNSRGKIELALLHIMQQIMNDLSRLSNDLIIFSMEQINYFTIAKEFCTGSSIMPQKKNPDVLELVRAYAAIVQGNSLAINNIILKLPSGYNRDLQLTKKPMIESFAITNNCLEIMIGLIKSIIVNEDKCFAAFTTDVLATDTAYELVKQGKTFRDAYKEIGNRLQQTESQQNHQHDLTMQEIKVDKKIILNNIKEKKNLGHTGNLGLDNLKEKILQLKSANEKKQQEFEAVLMDLLK